MSHAKESTSFSSRPSSWLSIIRVPPKFTPNVSAKPIIEQSELKENLIQQLTSSVQWYQTINNMINDGAKKYIEVGPGNVLIGLNRRINKEVSSEKAKLENN